MTTTGQREAILLDALADARVGIQFARYRLEKIVTDLPPTNGGAWNTAEYDRAGQVLDSLIAAAVEARGNLQLYRALQAAIRYQD